ncbi:hypothetical protein SALBM135S_01044 [Streptomyces alboniger]
MTSVTFLESALSEPPPEPHAQSATSPTPTAAAVNVIFLVTVLVVLTGMSSWVTRKRRGPARGPVARGQGATA